MASRKTPSLSTMTGQVYRFVFFFGPTGVGYSWIDGLKAHAEASVTDEQMTKAAERYPIDTPETKEAYFIRQTFEQHFPTDTAAKTAVRWIPRAVRIMPCLALWIRR